MRHASKYRQAHQSGQECQRRLRQVRAGRLSGAITTRHGLEGKPPRTIGVRIVTRPAADFVSEAARYAAHGLVIA